VVEKLSVCVAGLTIYELNVLDKQPRRPSAGGFSLIQHGMDVIVKSTSTLGQSQLVEYTDN
jgi:hypothetical protein